MKRRTRAQLRGCKVCRVPRIIYDPTAMKAIELLSSRGYRAEDVALVMGAGRTDADT